MDACFDLSYMRHQRRIFGLADRSIGKLLEIASVPGDESLSYSDADEEKADLLRQRLQRRIKSDRLVVSAILEQNSSILETIGALPDKTTEEWLLNPHTSLSLLHYIKDFSAKQSRTARSEAERQTANVIYYAAIAAALVFHQEKKTGLSHAGLIESFGKLIELKWSTPKLKDLFNNALSVCHEQEKTDST